MHYQPLPHEVRAAEQQSYRKALEEVMGELREIRALLEKPNTDAYAQRGTVVESRIRDLVDGTPTMGTWVPTRREVEEYRRAGMIDTDLADAYLVRVK